MFGTTGVPAGGVTTGEDAAAPPGADGAANNVAGVPTFLVKTHTVVSDPACDDVVSWTADGLAFVIWKADEFVSAAAAAPFSRHHRSHAPLASPCRFAERICPVVFRHAKMTSFVRNLHLYGFRKVSDAPHAGLQFAHACFVRADPGMMRLMRRQKKGDGAPADHGHAQVREAVAQQVAQANADCVRLQQQRQALEQRVDALAGAREELYRRLDCVDAETRALRVEFTAERARQRELEATVARLGDLILGHTGKRPAERDCTDTPPAKRRAPAPGVGPEPAAQLDAFSVVDHIVALGDVHASFWDAL